MKKIRRWVNRNSTLITVGSVVVMILALAFMVRILTGGDRQTTIDPPKHAWFFDLTTKELFKGGLNDLPPIDAPSGPFNDKPGGVKAHVFACGHCDDPSQYIIAYLEAYLPETKEKLLAEVSKRKAQFDGDYPIEYLLEEMAMYEGRYIKRVDDENWSTWNSTEGVAIQKVFRELSKTCRAKGKDMRLRPCWPKND